MVWGFTSSDVNPLQFFGVDESHISAVPINYFDTFIEEWYNMGGKQITKEANEWWSNK